MKALYAADLFCGAGGTSTGLARAAGSLGRRLRLTAVNHWERAVETHAANHPAAAHHCEDLTTLDPRKAVPGGRLDILVASPECTHHSVARGGMPVNDQNRASAWCVLRWATALRIDRILIENVPEFVTWGPIGTNGRPLRSKRGETFGAFVKGLESLGYRVEWRVLNAADFGGATTRKRLFVQAVLGRRSIRWPNRTHEPNPADGLFGVLPKWRAAREVIDWRLAGGSIFDRKRPLSANTLKRIEAGLRKFGGSAAEPFIVMLNGGGRLGEGGVKSVDDPMPTVLTRDRLAVIEPFILPPEGIHRGNAPRSVETPMQTVTAGRGGGCVVQPFIVPQFSGNGPRSVDQPAPTLTTTSRGVGLCEPFMVPYYGTGEADGVNDPMRTITTRDRLGLVCPDGFRRDILFRMLQPHELAAAMGFPTGYRITGNRAEQVRQIGNAVEVNTAAALAAAMLEEVA